METQESYEAPEPTGGCSCVLALLGINLLFGGISFDFAMKVFFGLEFPWYVDVFAGLLLGELSIPAALIGLILVLVGVL